MIDFFNGRIGPILIVSLVLSMNIFFFTKTLDFLLEFWIFPIYMIVVSIAAVCFAIALWRDY
jgi:hypothetical protein